MSLFINMVCDYNDCKQLQPVSFDHFEETWQDLLDSFISAGWKLELSDQKIVKAICPLHK